jgi:hypothetical protein
MTRTIRVLPAIALAGAMTLAAAAHADNWHGRGHYYHHGYNGNAAGAAIVGGLIGLGVGAAIASNGYYAPPAYYPPPPAYYAPPPRYYAPPPPAVYYGY